MTSHAVLLAELLETRQVLRILMGALDFVSIECETDADGAAFDAAYLAARELLATAPVPASDTPAVCRWTEDDDGVWWTSCGHAYTFTVGGPVENHQVNCGYCGQRLHEAPAPVELGEGQ